MVVYKKICDVIEAMTTYSKIFILLLFSSCAKFSYIAEQGVGQVLLEVKGKDNTKVLDDPKVEDSHKQKIRVVQKAKEYFFTYFNKEANSIYDQTTFLKNDAVTYLVIHSPKNEIKAIKTSFPIAGEFPYLGFFSLQSAKEYKLEKEREGFVTFIRPVYAYSTLNQWIFNDNILSSFFHFSDEDLIELVFHELIHTVFFVKDEVALNEAIAEVMAKELLFQYLDKSGEQQKEFEQKREKQQQLSVLVSQLAKKLNEQYKGSQSPSVLLQDFLSNEFTPIVAKKCKEVGLKSCWPLRGNWNNARFAAFLTYQQKRPYLEQFLDREQMNPKKFLNLLETSYKEYRRTETKQSFSSYLKKKLQ